MVLDEEGVEIAVAVAPERQAQAVEPCAAPESVRTSTLASRFIGVTPLRPDPALDGRATSFCRGSLGEA